MALATTVDYRALGELYPDSENPRLPAGIKGQLAGDDLLIYLADTFDPLIIAESIARYGYFASEPMIVCREDGRWIVLEGNRRLTALLGLARPALRAQFDDRGWRTLHPNAEIDEDTRVPVLVADAREDADAVIGFRHIGQAMAWKPLQRAQFIAHLIDVRGHSFDVVADTVGEEEDSVRMLYRNQSVLVSARDLGRSDVFELGQQRFGTYTAALNRNALREFVGVAPVAEVTERVPQLPEPRLRDLVELFSWLYGLDGERKVIRESRELSMLAAVVRRPDALSELRRTRDLDEAYAMTPAPAGSFLRQLGIAVGNLRAVAQSIDLIADDPRTRERVDEVGELHAQLEAALDDYGT